MTVNTDELVTLRRKPKYLELIKIDSTNKNLKILQDINPRADLSGGSASYQHTTVKLCSPQPPQNCAY